MNIRAPETSSSTADARFSKRLAIIVPHRDRAQHLAQFVPHMLAYFARDKLDHRIDFAINVSEQKGSAPRPLTTGAG